MHPLYSPPVSVASPVPEDEAARLDTDMVRCIVARRLEGKRVYSFHSCGGGV